MPSDPGQAVVPARLRGAEGRGPIEAAHGRGHREQGGVPSRERRDGDRSTSRTSRAAARPSEVTLWAVDYGVLSLTAYRTPDVLGSVYVHKALQVLNADSRQRIVSRRVLTPKGATDGGGGGADAGAGTLRKDFRVLAFWLGSVTTDAQGRGSVEVKLPESLTTYRIMAVAADRNSRFGSADNEVRVNKPITLKPTFPRFLAVGDTAVIRRRGHEPAPDGRLRVVTMKSLDPDGPGAHRPAPRRPSPIARRRLDRGALRRGRASESAARACR